MGSVRTTTSASVAATPSCSSACSVASSTVLPATSTHSTADYRSFLVFFERDRFCVFAAAAASSADALPADVPLGFFPLAGAPPPVLPPLRPLLVGRFVGGTVEPATDVPSVAVDTFLAGFGAGFGACFATCFDLGDSNAAASDPFDAAISRSAATGFTIPVRNITSCVPILIADETTM